MIKEAYELGIQLALEDAGLVKTSAAKDFLRALEPYAMGAGLGAAAGGTVNTFGEGSPLEGALTGALMGSGAVGGVALGAKAGRGLGSLLGRRSLTRLAGRTTKANQSESKQLAKEIMSAPIHKGTHYPMNPLYDDELGSAAMASGMMKAIRRRQNSKSLGALLGITGGAYGGYTLGDTLTSKE